MGESGGRRTVFESEGEISMIDIIKLLKENKKVDDFRVILTKTQSHESFFVHKKLETVRATDTEDATVTVYVNCDGAKGDSSFAVYNSMTEEEVREKIEKSAHRASLVKNKPYSLVEGDTLFKEEPSNFTDFSAEELSAKIADAVFEADAYVNGSINALEIFVNRDTIRVINSRGVDKTHVKHRAMIEAIPTWTENGESVELYEAYHFTRLAPEEITAEINQKMQEVRDRQYAQKLPAGNYDVLLNPPEISSLLHELVGDLNYQSVYSHSNLHKIGDKIQQNPCDPLSITMCHHVPGSRFSAVFDEDGLTLEDKLVVDEGKVCGYYGSNRFGQYIGEKPTGNLRCIRLKTGSMQAENLQGATYLECVSLSGLQVDLYNDYIGGEIRLAYLYENGKKTPITGISMSGRLSTVLESIRLSSVETAKDGYMGPSFVLLKEVSVL